MHACYILYTTHIYYYILCAYTHTYTIPYTLHTMPFTVPYTHTILIHMYTHIIGGIIKDIMLVALSFTVFNSPVTLIQLFGYSISLTGINAYKNYKSNPELFTRIVYDTIGTGLSFLSGIVRIDLGKISALNSSINISAGGGGASGGGMSGHNSDSLTVGGKYELVPTYEEEEEQKDKDRGQNYDLKDEDMIADV